MNDDTKIKCTYCGALVDITETTCPQCCAPLKPAQQLPTQQVPSEPAPGKKEGKQLAPTAIAALVCGILSITLSSAIIPGFILSAIGKRKANEGYDAIATNPDLYTGEGFLNAGRITSKVGLILSIVWIPILILYCIFYAAMLFD